MIECNQIFLTKLYQVEAKHWSILQKKSEGIKVSIMLGIMVSVLEFTTVRDVAKVFVPYGERHWQIIEPVVFSGPSGVPVGNHAGNKVFVNSKKFGNDEI